MASAEALLQLMTTSQACDVKFKVKCGGSWIPFFAHKLVLSMWSPIFEDKFFKNPNSFLEEVEIADVLPSSFQAFLRFLYGLPSELDDNKNNVELVLDVYKAADKYQVQKLKTFCCEILNFSSINKDNVFKLMDAARLISSYLLRERCSKVLQAETRAILNLHSVDKIKLSAVKTLLQARTLSLSSEFELLTWVYKWAKFQLEEVQPIKDPKEIINPLLSYLNFAALTSEEFAKLVSNNTEFFDKVDCFNIFMNKSVPEWSDLPPWYDKNKNLHLFEKGIFNVIDKDFAPKAELDNIVNDEFSCDDSKASAKQSNSYRSNSNTNTQNTVNNSASTINNDSIENSTKDLEVGKITEEGSDKESIISTLNEGIASAIDIKADSMISVDESVNAAVIINNHEISSNETSKEILSTVCKTNTTESLVGTNNVTLESESCNSSSIAADSMFSQNTHNLGMVRHNNKASHSLSDRVNLNDQKRANDISSMTEEMHQDKNSGFERTILEKGNTWKSLDPTIFRKKIKKKKVRKFHMLPESKSIPTVGQWNSEIGSLLSSGDYKLLMSLIEKQHCHHSLY